jgi:hypothetical protein
MRITVNLDDAAVELLDASAEAHHESRAVIPTATLYARERSGSTTWQAPKIPTRRRRGVRRFVEWISRGTIYAEV